MNKKELIELHFKGATELYKSELTEKEDYYIFANSLIDDCYWNMGILKNFNSDINLVWDNIKKELESRNRKPVLYVIPSDNFEISNDFELLYTDVWIAVDNLKRFEKIKSKIDVKFEKVTDNLKDKFVKAVMDGFSGEDPNDPYEALTDGYKKALYNSFENIDDEYKSIHYAGIHNEEVVSTATVIYKGKNALIYNVTTKKEYQKMGICREMLSYIVSDLIEKGVEIACGQTEQGFYTEKLYKAMGGKEIMLGRAFTKKD